ncbi:MAG: domain protein putative component of TonB system, partial [Labilithrix sp.]|nr:domain protein putative component of TonB system [Labilithrix sp.]
MASDDESTQPIDIEALRSSLPAGAGGARPKRDPTDVMPAIEEGAPTDEHTAIATYESGDPFGGAAPAHAESSVTRIEVAVAAPPPEEEAAAIVSPPSTAHFDMAHSLPGTVPAHELVEALVAVMGTRSERMGGGVPTVETELALPSFDIDDPHGPGTETRADSTRSSGRETDEPATATRLPFPAGWSSDVEVTSVSPGRAVVSSGLRRAPSAPPTHADATHPADDPDETRIGRLEQAEVRAIFATAEAGEATAIVYTPKQSDVPPLDPEADREPQLAPEAPDSASGIHEVDSAELESDHDVAELASTSDDLGDSGVAPFPPEARRAFPSAPRAEELGALPRFSMASMDDIALRTSDPDIVLSADEPDVNVESGQAESANGAGDYAQEISDDDGEHEEISDDEIEPDADEISYDDEGVATLFGRRDAAPALTPAPAPAKSSPPPKRPTAVPPAGGAQPAYQPPAPVGRALGPAYEIDTDEDEDQLQREDSFHALLDLYRLRLADADTPTAKANLLHKIASVHELRLAEPEQAFAALVEAFDLRPGDDDIVASLDRVAKAEGRVGELADRARKNLHTADLELKTILLGHLVYWYERVLGRSQEMSPFVSELERLDKTHPIALRRQAQMAAANGDLKSQRELLLRALDRTSRREEKVHLHIALASAHAGTPEAVKHYEAAVANDASSIVALQGLERIGRDQGKHAQVEWCLERQVEVAQTSAERVDALLKLAELHETKYLKRERAAEILERIVLAEPSHPQALKALERCYHALRDWPRLAKVLRARADNTYDKQQKTDLLELAAEVYESKLGDPNAAIEVHRDLLVVDPKHRRALTDLARLYEKLGDWGNMSTYKARVAELAPTKRQASQLLVQLGDFLSAPDRDAIAARLQYERAVTVDATNAAAWEALQRVAAAAGDDRRAAECLEQRARNVDGPRQRAAIFVELAMLHSSNGADRAAREAFEEAIAADATNEAAAVPMLDAYTREEKWAEAAPLCELLVNAAKRDNDPRALFTRLRLATRIGAALGDPDRAMTSSLAALDLEPEDQGAQADLVAVCSQCREQPRVIARAKERLQHIASGPGALPAGVLVSLAQLQRDAGEVDAAAGTLERALDLEPDSPEVLKELAEVYLAQGDYPRCCKLKVDMARNAMTADARFQLLCDAGEIWARKADELDKAASVFEEARLIKPLDHWLLHTLLWLYGERHRWDDLSNVLESIAQIQESPEKKAKSFFAMAQVVLEKVGDPIRAAELFDQVLDIDKKRLDAFEQLVRALTEAKDWEFLERSYRKMIARTKDDPEPNANLQFALFHQLGLIYRDRLDDAEHAYESLDAAARIRPDDADVRRIVTELLVVTDNLDAAVSRTRELIERDPHDAELYSELYELFLRQHFFDKAWCAVNVLAQMREPNAEQRRFHEDYAPMPLAEVPGQIVEQAWQSHVLHRDLDPTLTLLFSRMTPAVARMRYAQLRPDQLVYAAGRPFTNQHSRLYEAIRITFANAAEILHMSPPELLLGDPSSLVPFAPALAPFGAIHVSAPAVEARAESLIYVVGKRLAEQRPELIARAFFPAVSDLTSLLAAAVRVGRQEGAKDAIGAALDA